MSHYLGSKARHADEILHHVLSAAKPGGTYVEPFVGGGNVLTRVPVDLFATRIAADRNKWMVALHTAVRDGWVPPVLVTPAEFNAMKKWAASDRAQKAEPDKYPAHLIGFVACGCSFGSMWFSSFAKDDAGKPAGTRCRQSSEACVRDAPGFQGAQFFHSDFDKLSTLVDIPPDALWYCDPPYAKTTGYEGAAQIIPVGVSLADNEWKADKFWKWANRLVEKGATVFVSEYSPPKLTDIWPDAPDSVEAKAVAAEIGRSQKCDASDTAEEKTRRDELWVKLNHIRDETSVAFYKDKQNLWEVVWEKEVHVNIAGGAVAEARKEDSDAAPKKETEKLFRRMP